MENPGNRRGRQHSQNFAEARKTPHAVVEPQSPEDQQTEYRINRRKFCVGQQKMFRNVGVGAVKPHPQSKKERRIHGNHIIHAKAARSAANAPNDTPSGFSDVSCDIYLQILPSLFLFYSGILPQELLFYSTEICSPARTCCMRDFAVSTVV